jgi:DNA-binding MarR family transcriptional regulator
MRRPPDHPPGPFPRTPPEGVEPALFAVFQAFNRVGRAHRMTVGSIVGEPGGHPAQAGCLRVIAAHDGISQRDVARSLFLTPPTVTGMLQRMERDGLVERRPDPDDQRITRVYLTETGRELANRARARFVAHINRMLEDFSPEDLAELERLLNRMAENLREADE